MFVICVYYTDSSLLLLAYSERTNIAKQATGREGAIKTAITKYNAAARALDPPCPPISASDLLSKTFISELELLKDARTDIRGRPWADPAMRTFMDQYFRLQRAKEEIERLNVEIRRLRTWIRDEEAWYERVIRSLSNTDPALAFELRRRLTIKTRVNNRLWRQLTEIEYYRGFTGTTGCGVGEYTVEGAETHPDRFSQRSNSGPGPLHVPPSTPLPKSSDNDAVSVGSFDDTEHRQQLLDALDERLAEFA